MYVVTVVVTLALEITVDTEKPYENRVKRMAESEGFEPPVP